MPSPESPSASGLSPFPTPIEIDAAHALLAIQQLMSERIAEQLAPRDLFQSVIELLGERLGWDLGAAWWGEQGSDTFGCQAVWHRRGSWAERLEQATRSGSLEIEESFAGSILATGEPRYVKDARTSGESWPTLQRSDVAAAIGIPLIVGGGMQGVVAFYSATRRGDDGSVAWLASVGAQLGQYLDRWRAHELLRRSDRALAAAANGVVIADATRPGFPLVYANAGFERLTGYSPDEVLGLSCALLQGEDTDRSAVAEFVDALSRGRECKTVLRNYRKDGTPFWNEVVLSPVYQDGELIQYIGLQYDVTEREEAEERVWYLAYHDSLTGLANRAMLAKHIDRALERATENGREVALLFLDLDDFKVINDGLGHASGDEVLCQVAEVLRSVTRANDLLVRQGGDEFLVLLADIDGDGEAAASRFAEEIMMALRKPLRVGELEIPIRASAGISVFPHDAPDVEGLLKNSDHSMYRAKRAGGSSFRVYQRGRSSEQARAIATAGAEETRPEPSAEEARVLSEALAPGIVRTLFQPIVDLATRRPVAYEALARGPQGSSLERPDLLFAAARTADRLGHLDWTCRGTALRTARDAGLSAPRSLFINVEPEALDVPCPPELERDWAEAGQHLRPVLEITERALTAQPAALLRSAREIRERGWGLALDDVGADTRSLALMPLLRPDVIKLDLRLVQEQPGAEVAEIVNAVNAERERTGALILAEGIETEQHLETALSMGATLGQGWLFGRPGVLDPALVGETSGLTLTAPPLEVTGTTPYDVVSKVRATRPGAKRLLLALSNQLEQQAMTLGSGAVVISAFQSAERFTPRTKRRYTALAADAAFVAALGVEMDPEPAPGVRGASLPSEDPLFGEWSIAVLGPHFAGALVAMDQGDGGADFDRGFDFALTYDRDLVIQAANSLLTRVLAR